MLTKLSIYERLNSKMANLFTFPNSLSKTMLMIASFCGNNPTGLSIHKKTKYDYVTIVSAQKL